MPSTIRPIRRQPGIARASQNARKDKVLSLKDMAPLPVVLAGDVWQLGEHLLLCGDSTLPSAVQAIMRGELADLMVTDPPYGVGYTGRRLVRRAIRNDDLASQRLHRFLAAAFSAAPLKPGGCFYICAPAGSHLEPFLAAAAEATLNVRQTLVWVKNHFVISRGDYHYRHEMLLYGWKPGAPHYYAGGRKQHSVWNFDKPQKSPLHPTTKPIALLERAILNNSREGEIVYDGFSGSGSTLIACEHTGRRCRAIEIEAHYAAVTVARWEQVTGRKAELISRGDTVALAA